MELEKGERVINKIKKKKGFKLVTKARNLWFHIKDTTLQDHTTHSIFNTLVRESYYGGIKKN